MSALIKGMATVAAIVAAAGAGLWAGQTGVIKLPLPASMVATETPPAKATGPVIYYRDPSGKPLYALTPKSTDDGQPYVAVHASEDVNFDKAKAKAEPTSSERKFKFYRNPMGLPDISPTPKKDAMGMDYIPVYEDEGGDGSSSKSRRARSNARRRDRYSRQTRNFAHDQSSPVSFSSMSGASLSYRRASMVMSKRSGR